MLRSARHPKAKLPNAIGYTLLELLVGLFLSLLIIGVALAYMATSAQTFKTQTAESIIQENARFALELLTQNLRLAGLNPTNSFANTMDVIFSGAICPASEAAQGNGTAGTTACSKDGANDTADNNSDRIAIDYMVNGNVRGCNNQSINVSGGDELRLASVFWTADLDDDGIRSLYCQTYDLEANVARGSALPLVDGVDRMQVQYGVDSNEDGIVERYQSFTNLGANNSNNVRVIRVALLISSGLGIDADSNTEDEASRNYTLLDAPEDVDAIEFNDRKLRQIYSTSVLVPNSL